MKAIIFDMDGVIFDSEKIWQRVFKQTNALFGYSLAEHDRIRWCGLPESAIRQLLASEYPFVDVVPYRKKLLALYSQAMERGEIPLKTGFTELVAFLKEKKLPIGLATGSTGAQVEKMFRSVGLDYRKIFDFVANADLDLPGKPNPEIYLVTCKRLGVEPVDAVVLEDSPNGLTAAIKAGCKTIFVKDLIEPAPEIVEKCISRCNNLIEAQREIEKIFKFNS